MTDKQYLDYAGLKDYDALIKAWVEDHVPATEGEAYDDTEIRELISEIQSQIPAAYDDTALAAAIEAVDAKVGANTVANQISAAIATLVNSAPSNLDTLKEIADWITTHGETAAALVTTVAEQGQAISDLAAEVAGITAISGTYIEALFLEPVELEDGQTVQDVLDNLEAGQKLVLTEDTNENFTIGQDAVIEAEGVTFTGTITVNQGVEATIIGATFAGEVKMASPVSA